MTALAQNSPEFFHPGPGPTRRATKVLRGIKIYIGAVCALHNDRLMPYPPGGFGAAASVAKTVAQGGPLLLNIDSSQWVGVIAKVPNVRLAMTVSGAGTVTALSITYGSTIDISFNIGSTATSALVVSTLRANADVMRLIDIGVVSIVGGSATAQTITSVPHVRIAGVADLAVDNSANTSDLTWSDEQPLTLKTGRLLVTNDATDPANSGDAGGTVALFDDQTIVRTPVPLLLPVVLFDWQPKGPYVSIP